MSSRVEYVAWAKQRALQLVDEGDLPGALASIISDLRKEPETDGPHLHALTIVGAGHTSNPAAMRSFIEGFA